MSTTAGSVLRNSFPKMKLKKYLQDFIGIKAFRLTKPLTPAALVAFCKRANHKRLAQVNELILPAESADQETERKRNEERKPIREWSLMTERAVVLIVDDNPENLFLLNEFLKDDYIVKAAKNGAQALQIAAEAKPELVLLDIMMPEMNGYSVCRKLKQNAATRNIPVLFISSLSATLDIVKAFEVGGVDYITKPFQPEEVKARVQTHLELYRTRQELQTLLSKTLTEKTETEANRLFLAGARNGAGRRCAETGRQVDYC